MSLLSDLTLTYENLADDPIEVGIHYGHSILGALSATLVPHFPEPVMETASAHSYLLPVTERVIQQPEVTRQQARGTISNQMTGRLRTSRESYTPRGFKPRAVQGYTPRTLVGTI